MTTDDFTNRAEAEMKLNDAKMVEEAQLRKLAKATLNERIEFALKKSRNDAEAAFNYMNEKHLIHEGENVTIETIKQTTPK